MTKELEFHAGRLPGHTEPDQEADRKPINYALLAIRYRWWLAGGAFAGLLLGFLAYLKYGPEYEATAQILVSRKSTVPLPEEQRTLGDWGERSEHLAIIQSPMIVTKAVELGQLRELASFKHETELDDVVEDIVSDLRVKRTSGQDRSFTNVLTLTYTNKNPQDARAVVQAIVAAYASYLDQTRKEKATEVLESAQQNYDDVLQKLREREQEYHAFRDTAPFQWKAPVGAAAADGQTTTNVHQERILAVEEQRRLNLLRQAELNSRLQVITQGQAQGEAQESLEVLIRRFLTQDGTGSLELLRQQDLGIFENRLLPLMLEEQRLTRDFGPDHPDVQSIRKSLASVKSFYRSQGVRLPEDRPRGPNGEILPPTQLNFIEVYLDSVRQQLAELKLRDQELEALVQAEQEKAKEVARFQAKDQSMSAELTRLRELWAQLGTQVNLVGIEKDGNGYTLKQLAPVKDTLSIKRIMKFVGAGTILGLAVLAALCVLRELQDTKLRTLSDLRATVRHPLLGSVTQFSTSVDNTQALAAQAHPALRYLRAPHSLEAENYRSLRAALTITADDARAKVIQITSPESGDGKSTTAANLAIAIAQSGRRVLLIDGDLRRPSIHRFFRIENEVGLTDILQGEVDWPGLVRSSVIENLSLLPAGRPPANPAELLSSPRLTQMLKDLRDEFDLILIDAPPLLAVSDPMVTGRRADGMLLVVRLGKTSLSVVAQCRELVRTNNLPVLGVVANGLTFGSEGDYSDTGYYYREYSAGSSVKEEPVGAL